MSTEEKAPKLGEGTPQCQFFVQRKKRLCRMTVKPGRHYCGEHEPQPQPKAENGEVDKRIPCPNDPKHTVYASKLLKHLSICNARRTEQPPYIVDNINAPEAVEACPRKPLSTVPKEALLKLIEKVNHLYAKYIEEHITAEPPQPIHHTVVAEFAAPERAESSRRHLRQTSALLWIVEREGLVRNNTCYVELGAGKGQLSYYACHAWCGSGGGRVLAVDRAPLRHKRDNKLRSAPPPRAHHDADSVTERDNLHSPAAGADSMLQKDLCFDPTQQQTSASMVDQPIDQASESDTTYVPKSDDISESVQDVTGADVTVCTELSPKARIVKSVRTEVGSDVAVRLRADLAHLALDAVPAVVASAGVVGLAKHLCGVATDYALRCVAAPGVVEKTHGVVLATCCHHRCEQAPYVAHRQLQELGIDAEEFNIMLGVVSWATCGDGRSRERRRRPPSPPGGGRGPLAPPAPGGPGPLPPAPGGPGPLAPAAREAAGRRAKALLDYGRVLWLRERGFEARLCHYVPSAVSLENVCLVARKR